MENWKIGQKLICINNIGWQGQISKLMMKGPKFNEIVTIKGFTEDTVILEEYPNQQLGYMGKEFKPIQENYKLVSYTKVIERNKELVIAN